MTFCICAIPDITLADDSHVATVIFKRAEVDCVIKNASSYRGGAESVVVVPFYKCPAPADLDDKLMATKTSNMLPILRRTTTSADAPARPVEVWTFDFSEFDCFVAAATKLLEEEQGDIVTFQLSLCDNR